MNMIPKREADKGKAQLKRFLQEMGAKISNENEKDDVWAINAQLGNFTIPCLISCVPGAEERYSVSALIRMKINGAKLRSRV